MGWHRPLGPYRGKRCGMTVYVDDYRVPATVGRIRARWSHLFVPAGTDLEELHQFAESIGLRRSWFQGPPGMYCAI